MAECGGTWESYVEEEDMDGDATHVCGREAGHDDFCICYRHLCWPGAGVATRLPGHGAGADGG